MDASILGQQVGVKITLNVLNAQQQYFSALQNQDAVRYQYLILRLNPASLVGTLGEADVEAVNRYLMDASD